ncbi:MAG: hypothetical protein AB7N73_07405 [Gemmatimonadales bacterium]
MPTDLLDRFERGYAEGRGTATFVLADGPQLIRVDTAGVFRKVGRAGEGPGEYRQVWQVGQGERGGPYWLADMRLMRLSRFGLNGAYLSSSGLPTTLRQETGALHAGFTFPFLMPAPERLVGYINVPAGGELPPWAAGRERGDLAIVAYGTDGGNARIIGWLGDQGQCTRNVPVRGRTAFLPIAFCTSPRIVSAGIGSAFALIETRAAGTERAAAWVHRIDADGDTLYSTMLPVVAAPATRAAADSAREALAKGMPLDFLKQAVRELPAPQYYQLFQHVLAAGDGSVWVETIGAGGARSWLVLDPRGRVARRILVPAGVTLMAVVGTEFAWGVLEREDGSAAVLLLRASR